MSVSQGLPRRGEVWLATFDPVLGHEQGGVRPGLVVSTDEFNRGRSRLVALAPLTTRERGATAHIRITPPEGGVDRPSLILCDQLRFVTHMRLGRRFGVVAPSTLAAVEDMLRRLLGL